MIKTRDLVLFLVVVFFLILAIGVSFWSEVRVSATGPSLTFVNDEIDPSVVVFDKDIGRKTRLQEYRDKIAAGATLFIQTEFYEADDVTNPDAPVDSVATLQQCAGYNVYQGALIDNTSPLVTVGANRVIYGSVSSGSVATSSATNQSVVLALPSNGTRTGVQSCVTSDVVGVTLGGTLIRNGEAARYAVFPETTLIGYALDGFPIYGGTAEPLDDCGGREAAGGYRYHATPGGDYLLNCFSGTPVVLR